MSKFVTVEVCADGTLTRANARALNRLGAWCNAFSGSTEAAFVAALFDEQGRAYRIVQAATLTGADKGAHTREVNRSRAAQARRAQRKTAQAA